MSDETTSKRERQAWLTLAGVNVFQYTVIAVWTIVSLKIGTLIVRMSLWSVQTSQTAIFCIFMCKLRATIARVNSGDEETPRGADRTNALERAVSES